MSQLPRRAGGMSTTATDDLDPIIARIRLARARKVFESREWDVLPQTERGKLILQWGADHAWMADPDNPERSVRNWCQRWAPWLTAAELDEIVAKTRTSNKRWTPDQCAHVLEVSFADHAKIGLDFHLGCNDDPDYELRTAREKTMTAARARKSRASKSTGAKVGRPPLQLSEEEARARNDAEKERGASRRRKNGSVPREEYLAQSKSQTKPWEALGISRRTYERRARETLFDASSSGKTPSRDLSNIGTVTQFLWTDLRQAERAAPERPIERPACATTSASSIDLTGFDFAKFGIVAVRVMRGRDAISTWSAPP